MQILEKETAFELQAMYLTIEYCRCRIMAIITTFQAEDGCSIRLTGSISVCRKTWSIRVTWDDETARSNRVTPTKTDIKKVKRKKRRKRYVINFN